MWVLGGGGLPSIIFPFRAHIYHEFFEYMIIKRTLVHAVNRYRELSQKGTHIQIALI